MKKLLALILAALMLLGLCAACNGGSTDGGNAAANTPAASGGSTASPGGTSASGADSTAAEAPADESFTFPLSEAATLTDWKQIGSTAVLTSWNDCAGYIELEKHTNVHIDFETPAYGNEQEQFNLMINSLDFPDILEYFSSYYSRGIDDGIEQEIILELSDIIDQYMPNYKALIGVGDRKLKTTTDTGNVGSIYCIYTEPQAPWNGLAIRQDWLDNLGLSVPRTYDEVYNVLTAFKREYNPDAPMTYSNIQLANIFGHLWTGGFGAVNDMQQDGSHKVSYGPLLPGYKEYLATFAKWYAEGLIDPDFTTRTDINTLLYNDGVGIGTGFGGDYQTLNGQPSNPEFKFRAMQNPVKNAGETTHFRVSSSDIGVGNAISTGCENVELAARWIDYCYSAEGSLYLNFGIEGTTWAYNDEGLPQLNSQWMYAFYNNDNWYNVFQATGPVEGPYLREMWDGTPTRRSDVPTNEYQLWAAECWLMDGEDWLIPFYASATNEESTEYAAIMGDINTCVLEHTLNIITGAEDVESGYDTMANQVKSMGVDRAIELMQARVDRYYAR